MQKISTGSVYINSILYKVKIYRLSLSLSIYTRSQISMQLAKRRSKSMEIEKSLLGNSVMEENRMKSDGDDSEGTSKDINKVIVLSWLCSHLHTQNSIIYVYMGYHAFMLAIVFILSNS